MASVELVSRSRARSGTALAVATSHDAHLSNSDILRKHRDACNHYTEQQFILRRRIEETTDVEQLKHLHTTLDKVTAELLWNEEELHNQIQQQHHINLAPQPQPISTMSPAGGPRRSRSRCRSTTATSTSTSSTSASSSELTCTISTCNSAATSLSTAISSCTSVGDDSNTRYRFTHTQAGSSLITSPIMSTPTKPSSNKRKLEEAVNTTPSTSSSNSRDATSGVILGNRFQASGRERMSHQGIKCRLCKRSLLEQGRAAYNDDLVDLQDERIAVQYQRLLPLPNGGYVHYTCYLWSCRERLSPIAEVNRACKKKCFQCRSKGGNIQCSGVVGGTSTSSASILAGGTKPGQQPSAPRRCQHSYHIRCAHVPASDCYVDDNARLLFCPEHAYQAKNTAMNTNPSTNPSTAPPTQPQESKQDSHLQTTDQALLSIRPDMSGRLVLFFQLFETLKQEIVDSGLNVTVDWMSSALDQHKLRMNVTLQQFEQGIVLSIIGPNGLGKSTVLGVLCFLSACSYAVYSSRNRCDDYVLECKREQQKKKSNRIYKDLCRALKSVNMNDPVADHTDASYSNSSAVTQSESATHPTTTPAAIEPTNINPTSSPPSLAPDTSLNHEMIELTIEQERKYQSSREISAFQVFLLNKYFTGKAVPGVPSYLLPSFARFAKTTTSHLYRLMYGRRFHARVRYMTRDMAQEMAYRYISNLLIAVQYGEDRFSKEEWQVSVRRYYSLVGVPLSEYAASWPSLGSADDDAALRTRLIALDDRMRLQTHDAPAAIESGADDSHRCFPSPSNVHFRSSVNKVLGRSVIVTGRGFDFEADRCFLRDELAKIVERDGQTIILIDVYAPCDILFGIEIWDCPGTDERDVTNRRITRFTFGRVNCAVLMLKQDLDGNRNLTDELEASGSVFFKDKLLNKHYNEPLHLAVVRYCEQTNRLYTDCSANELARSLFDHTTDVEGANGRPGWITRTTRTLHDILETFNSSMDPARKLTSEEISHVMETHVTVRPIYPVLFAALQVASARGQLVLSSESTGTDPDDPKAPMTESEYKRVVDFTHTQWLLGLPSWMFPKTFRTTLRPLLSNICKQPHKTGSDWNADTDAGDEMRGGYLKDTDVDMHDPVVDTAPGHVPQQQLFMSMLQRIIDEPEKKNDQQWTELTVAANKVWPKGRRSESRILSEEASSEFMHGLGLWGKQLARCAAEEVKRWCEEQLPRCHSSHVKAAAHQRWLHKKPSSTNSWKLAALDPRHEGTRPPTHLRQCVFDGMPMPDLQSLQNRLQAVAQRACLGSSARSAAITATILSSPVAPLADQLRRSIENSLLRHGLSPEYIGPSSVFRATYDAFVSTVMNTQWNMHVANITRKMASITPASLIDLFDECKAAAINGVTRAMYRAWLKQSTSTEVAWSDVDGGIDKILDACVHNFEESLSDRVWKIYRKLGSQLSKFCNNFTRTFKAELLEFPVDHNQRFDRAKRAQELITHIETWSQSVHDLIRELEQETPQQRGAEISSGVRLNETYRVERYRSFAEAAAPDDWLCPHPLCGLNNRAARSLCFNCDTARPITSSVTTTAPASTASTAITKEVGESAASTAITKEVGEVAPTTVAAPPVVLWHLPSAVWTRMKNNLKSAIRYRLPLPLQALHTHELQDLFVRVVSNSSPFSSQPVPLNDIISTFNTSLEHSHMISQRSAAPITVPVPYRVMNFPACVEWHPADSFHWSVLLQLLWSHQAASRATLTNNVTGMYLDVLDANGTIDISTPALKSYVQAMRHTIAEYRQHLNPTEHQKAIHLLNQRAQQYGWSVDDLGGIHGVNSKWSSLLDVWAFGQRFNLHVVLWTFVRPRVIASNHGATSPTTRVNLEPIILPCQRPFDPNYPQCIHIAILPIPFNTNLQWNNSSTTSTTVITKGMVFVPIFRPPLRQRVPSSVVRSGVNLHNHAASSFTPVQAQFGSRYLGSDASSRQVRFQENNNGIINSHHQHQSSKKAKHEDPRG